MLLDPHNIMQGVPGRAEGDLSRGPVTGTCADVRVPLAARPLPSAGRRPDRHLLHTTAGAATYTTVHVLLSVGG